MRNIPLKYKNRGTRASMTQEATPEFKSQNTVRSISKQNSTQCNAVRSRKAKSSILTESKRASHNLGEALTI